MEEHIAQSIEKNCCITHPTLDNYTDMSFRMSTKLEGEVETQENASSLIVSTCASEMADDEVRRSRKRRHRRGKSVHKHRLSKHRRDLLARAQRGGNRGVLGAPRNDNDFLMSQYIEGLHVEEAHTPPSNDHPRLADSSCYLPEEIGFFPAEMGDEIPSRHLHFSPSSSPGSCSPASSGSIYSDYSSLPSSPENVDHFNKPCPSSRPHPTDAAQLECSRGIVMDGTDADFLQRNFEEEYNNNITRGLQEATKDELISKCMKLTEKLKQLEQRKVLRLIASDVSREPRFSC